MGKKVQLKSEFTRTYHYSDWLRPCSCVILSWLQRLLNLLCFHCPKNANATLNTAAANRYQNMLANKNKTCSYFHFSLSLNSRHTFVSTQTAGVHIKKRDLKENRGITTATMKAQQQPKIWSCRSVYQPTIQIYFKFNRTETACKWHKI